MATRFLLSNPSKTVMRRGDYYQSMISQLLEYFSNFELLTHLFAIQPFYVYAFTRHKHNQEILSYLSIGL